MSNRSQRILSSERPVLDQTVAPALQSFCMQKFSHATRHGRIGLRDLRFFLLANQVVLLENQLCQRIVLMQLEIFFYR